MLGITRWIVWWDMLCIISSFSVKEKMYAWVKCAWVNYCSKKYLFLILPRIHMPGNLTPRGIAIKDPSDYHYCIFANVSRYIDPWLPLSITKRTSGTTVHLKKHHNWHIKCVCYMWSYMFLFPIHMKNSHNYTHMSDQETRCYGNSCFGFFFPYPPWQLSRQPIVFQSD